MTPLINQAAALASRFGDKIYQGVRDGQKYLNYLANNTSNTVVPAVSNSFKVSPNSLVLGGIGTGQAGQKAFNKYNELVNSSLVDSIPTEISGSTPENINKPGVNLTYDPVSDRLVPNELVNLNKLNNAEPRETQAKSTLSDQKKEESQAAKVGEQIDPRSGEIVPDKSQEVPAKESTKASKSSKTVSIPKTSSVIPDTPLGYNFDYQFQQDQPPYNGNVKRYFE